MSKSDCVEKPGFVVNNNLRFIDKGIECQVFEIVKMQLVCKVYDTDNDARYNYTLQRIAYRAGIGPEPMGLEKNYYFSRYIESYKAKLPFCKISGTAEYKEFLDEIACVFGGEWSDSHSGNIGIILVNGIRKFMIIDFGIAGFFNTKLGGLLAEKLQLYY